MKKILIATDFSPAAHHAAVYGIQLAKAIKADVFLFSAYQVPRPFAALNVTVSHFAVMEETRERLAAEADCLSEEYGARVEIVCEEGAPSDAILTIAKEKDVDLIVIGMTGNGKSLKRLFGGTATSVVNSLTIPVIVVPEGGRYSIPKDILYASDVFLDTSITGIDRVKWLTDQFGSKLFVVRVVKDSYEEVRENVNTPHNLRKELKTMRTSFTYPINKNTTDGLNQFVSKQPVDLMVMLPHKHEWMDRIFVKSETKDMLYHSHIPILMLPDTTSDLAKTAAVQTMTNYSYQKP